MTGENKQEIHRPGALKQTNKVHKTGRHRSKGSISVSNKGKIAVKTITKRNKHELSREQRRHQANQIRKNKRDEVLLKKRSIGGVDSAPFLVTLIPLNSKTTIDKVVESLKKSDEESVVCTSPNGITHICVPRFKQRFSFIVPRIDDQFGVLDCLKVSDFVVFLSSANSSGEDEIIDDFGQNLLMASFAQGLPTPIVAITEIENIPQKKRNDYKNLVQKSISKWFPELKLVTLDNNGDFMNLLRKIGSSKKKPVIYRDRRPHLIAEEFEFSTTNTINPGILKVSGYLRGSPLSVNNLIHIPGLGDFQMNRIESFNDPYSFDKKRKNSMDLDREQIEILQIADESKQESLDAENIPDPMDAEQTWPTEEELQEATATNEKLKKRKKAPPGWSEYQAAWIPDDDVEFYNDEDDDDDGSDTSDYMDAQSEEKSDDGDYNFEDATTQSEIAVNDDKYDDEFDLNKERDELEKIRAARVDKMFPDEIDTPLDQPARVRFQKYRGMESFRTSPWDVNENLPQDYARIFRFENFDRARKKIVHDLENRSEEEEGVKVGKYITIHVKDVPQCSWENFVELKQPLIVFGLYPFEHKMSVVNVVLKRTPNYSAAIKSKERLIFQCGYRRFETNPLFSQHTTGTRHKFERYFQPESTAVATFYGRIQFPPAPVLCYKQENDKFTLLATGSLLSCNPDRIILKRVVLSGHPFKIYKHSAVVRFMFFNRDDINYFKSIKLKTKLGRIGHIKEPLGTHGHIKCVFDGQLKSQDTVLMNLYKRVFPKWTYEDYVRISSARDADMDM